MDSIISKKFLKSELEEGSKRTENSVTFNPDSAKQGEQIFVTIPKLDANSCIVPNTLYLTADLKNENTKSWFLNNVGKLLVKKLLVKIGSKKAYENDSESIYRVYEDLWITEKQRKNMIYEGIANENTRKLMSKDDSADKTVASDKLMFKIIGSRIAIKLGQILNNHGVYAPYNMISDVKYEIKLPLAEEIMVAQSGQKIAGYSLKNIRLEYETIESPKLAEQTIAKYEMGRTLEYDEVVQTTKEKWDKDITHINSRINLQRNSMKAIVFLFKEVGTITDSEKYVYPNITELKITVEGKPNVVYSQGMKKDKLFKEARRFFQNEKRDVMEIDDFYSKHFAFVLDLRTFSNDGNITESGKKVTGDIQLEFTKEATTKDIMCYMFVVSDGNVNIIHKTLQEVDY